MSKPKANDLHNFTFRPCSQGAYRVTYTTDIRGDYWVNRIEDMTLIDATRNAEWAKAGDIAALRTLVKQGAHYSRSGKRLG